MGKIATARQPKVRQKAATKQVLGNQTEPLPDIKPKWRKHYDRLVQLHGSLAASKRILTQSAKEEKSVFSLHMADAGTDNYDQDFALSMASSEQNALYEIEQAIKRIKDGTYGVCEMTGKPIEPQRLEAIPWTRFSMAAERELEKRGEVPRTRLGQREEVPKAETDRETEEE